jgi:hypothetical protein
LAALSKAAELYQPAVAVLVSLPAFRRRHRGWQRRAEGGGNAGGQAITGGSADHQHLLGTILDGALGLGISDLATNIGFTTDRVSGGADKAANLGFDDHMGSRIRLMDEIGA